MGLDGNAVTDADAHARVPAGLDVPRVAGLLERARGGDRDALAALLRELAPLLLRTIRRVMGPGVDGEDAAQDAMIALVRELGSIRESRATIAYATRLAVRVALRARGRAIARANVPEVELDELGTADDAVDARERAARLLGLVDRLPTPQAEAFMLRCVHDYDLTEIAALSATTVNTIRSRIRLAREGLQRMLRRHPSLFPEAP